MNRSLLALVLVLGCSGSVCWSQPMEPALDAPSSAVPAEPLLKPGEAPAAATPLSPLPAVAADAVEAVHPTGALSRIGGIAGRVGNAVNPARLVNQARTGWRENRFYSTDYSVHASPWAAIKGSLKPLDMRANVHASLRNSVSPLSIVGSLIGPASVELNREMIRDGHITPSKLVHAFQPGAIVGGVAGGLAADVLGAATQSALAGTMGPFGPIAGFLARPLIGYTAYLIGSNFGMSVQHGKPSLKGALGESMLTVDPSRDMGSLIGGSLGGVIGQALIPIPVVGTVVGGIVGGMVGGMVGNWLGHHGFTGKLNSGAVSWLQRTGRHLLGSGKSKGTPPTGVTTRPPNLPGAVGYGFDPISGLKFDSPGGPESANASSVTTGP